MTLPIAIRTRIDFSEPPRRTRAVRMPRLAGPILAYWSAMGLLAYGVSSGALPLDAWLWPEPREPDAAESEPAPVAPPARVTPFPAEPPLARAAPGEPALEAEVTRAVDAPLAIAPPLASLDGAPAVRAPANEPRRLTLSLHPPVVTYDGEPAHCAEPPPRVTEPPARLDTAPERLAEASPPRGPRAPETTRLAMRAAPFEPTPHIEWTQPGWGTPARGRGNDGPLRLVAPDRARGARHVDDGSFLFPGEESSATRTPRAPVAGVAPSLHDEPASAAPAAARESKRAAASVGSCEAAAAAANDEMDLTRSGRSGPADVTRDAYASILDNGRYLSGCRIPGHVRFEICAAVKDGRAVGVTVTTTPRDVGVAACVRAAVTRLSFPVSPRLDVTRTRFDVAR